MLTDTHTKLYKCNTQIKLQYMRMGNWTHILCTIELRGHAEQKYQIKCFSFLVALIGCCHNGVVHFTHKREATIYFIGIRQ